MPAYDNGQLLIVQQRYSNAITGLQREAGWLVTHSVTN